MGPNKTVADCPHTKLQHRDMLRTYHLIRLVIHSLPNATIRTIAQLFDDFVPALVATSTAHSVYFEVLLTSCHPVPV